MNIEQFPDSQTGEEDNEDLDEVDKSLLLANELTDNKSRISVEKTADGETVMKIKDTDEEETN